MGRDKALLPFRGVTLIEQAIGTLRGMTQDVRILCGPTRRYEDFGIPVVVDDICGAGPLAGLYAALVDASSSDIGRIVWLGVDLPLVSTAVISTLVDGLADADAVMAHTERGPEPLCSAFRTDPCLSAVRSALTEGRLKLTAAIDGLALAKINVDPTVFANINTLGDYSALEQNATPRG